MATNECSVKQHWTIKCPKCHSRLQIAKSAVGKDMRCGEPGCEFTFRVSVVDEKLTLKPLAATADNHTVSHTGRNMVVGLALAVSISCIFFILDIQFGFTSPEVKASGPQVAANAPPKGQVVNQRWQKELQGGAVEISIKDLMDAYTNALTANKTYDGKRLIVSGVVHANWTGRNLMKDPETALTFQLQLRNPKDEQCFTKEMADLPITVAVTCEGPGKLNDSVRFRDCVLLTDQQQLHRAVEARKEAEIVKDEAEVRTGPVTPFTGDTDPLFKHPKHNRTARPSDIIVAFSGLCKQVRESPTDIIVTLQNQAGVTVKCHFHNRHLEELETLNLDDSLTVHGRVYMLWMGLTLELSSCVIINK